MAVVEVVVSVPGAVGAARDVTCAQMPPVPSVALLWHHQLRRVRVVTGGCPGTVLL